MSWRSTVRSPRRSSGLSRDGLALLARAARAAGAGRGRPPARSSAPSGRCRRAARPPRARGPRPARPLLRAPARRAPAAARGARSRELIERVLDGRLREHVLGRRVGRARLANVHKLLRLARRFEASEGRDLRGFLDHAERLDAARRRRARRPGRRRRARRGAADERSTPPRASSSRSCASPTSARAPHTSDAPTCSSTASASACSCCGLDGARRPPDARLRGAVAERRRAQAEEEDRILYVAMTRARERLLLSGAVDFERWPSSAETTADRLARRRRSTGTSARGAATRRPPVFDVAVAGRWGPALVGCRLNKPATVGEVMELAGEPERAAPTEASIQEAPVAPAPASPGDAATATPGEAPARGGPLAPLEAPVAPELPALSYTSLVELERCGYRYYLERVLGLGEERAGSRGPARGGPRSAGPGDARAPPARAGRLRQRPAARAGAVTRVAARARHPPAGRLARGGDRAARARRGARRRRPASPARETDRGASIRSRSRSDPISRS